MPSMEPANEPNCVLNTNTHQIPSCPVAPGGEEKEGNSVWAPYLMEALIDSADDAIVSKTLDGIITSWNKGAERVFGYSAQEAIGRPILMLIPPDRHNEEPAIIERIRSGERVDHYETIRRKKDGTLIDISLTVSPIYGPDGTILGASKVARDVTALKHALKQLEAERAKLAYLFNKAPAFVATLRGPEHVFEMTNPAYLQLIGHRQVLGKPVREAVPEAKDQGFFELLDTVFRSGEPFLGREMPIQLQREPNGPLEQRFLDFVYQPLFGPEAEVNGIFVHGIDITAQVQARKEAEAANRAKDEFLATLSHELRTPLNAILGWATLMSDSPLDEGQTRALDTIQRNAQLQAQLIEDILDVSRIISGKMRLEVRPTELSSVVEAAVESVLPAAQAKEIRLQRALDSGSVLVSGDPNRLQQVVWNLLSNAIKFTPKGGRVQIRLERVNSHIEIIVTDTGIGIPARVLPHVFDRFSQADSTSTRQYGGLGLGLAIVRHVVEMHGGTVEAESAGEGQGSTFTVKLPLIALRAVGMVPGKNLDREHPAAGRNIAFDCPPELAGVQVLVVDDEPDARSLVKAVLEKCGASVREASSVEEALRLLQEWRPHVLVSDLGMPGEDGYSLIQKVRALPIEEGGRTPAAALTAYARVEDRMKVLRSGFQIHIPKPVEPAELATVVANLATR